MTSERIIPDDPLAFIQRCIRERKILWTYHVQMRLKGRTLSREALLRAAGAYEIIESYPDDKYLPSYLVLADHQGTAFHILFGADVDDRNVRLVTAYRPSDEEWQPDLRTRRRKP